MSIEEFRWLLGLNLVVGVWLGMLASSWKGRNFYVWAVIGMLVNVAGLLVLALLPTQKKQSTAPRKVVEV